MARRALIDPLERAQRLRRSGSDVLTPVLGIGFGILATLGAFFMFQHIKQRMCPSDAFIIGSSPWATFIVIMLWLFLGFSVGMALAGFALSRLRSPALSAGGARPRRTRHDQIMRVGARIASWLVAPAGATFVYAALVGFCAGPEGVRYTAYPWSDVAIYRWDDVRQATVICHGSGRGSVSNFYLSMSDGSRFNLADLTRVANGGYPAVRTALEKHSVPYDDSRIQQDCGSALHYLRWRG